MISINREEAIALREKSGGRINIAITCRQKKGHRKCYYLEESRKALSLLEQVRKENLRREESQ